MSDKPRKWSALWWAEVARHVAGLGHPLTRRARRRLLFWLTFPSGSRLRLSRSFYHRTQILCTWTMQPVWTTHPSVYLETNGLDARGVACAIVMYAVRCEADFAGQRRQP